jgi:hypothetical protein
MRFVRPGCTVLAFLLAPAPAFAFTPLLFLFTAAGSAISMAGGAALSGAGVGVAGRAATGPSTDSIQAQDLRRKTTYTRMHKKQVLRTSKLTHRAHARVARHR